eukprot:m.145533 g.145533  ORF g.145533 m.145533 type:complete len:1001 (-) comp16786_c0_seq2:83-3085(-)
MAAPAGSLWKTVFAYSRTNEDELALGKDDIVEIVNGPEGGWWQGRKLGSDFVGWFPSTYVESHTPAVATITNENTDHTATNSSSSSKVVSSSAASDSGIKPSGLSSAAASHSTAASAHGSGIAVTNDTAAAATGAAAAGVPTPAVVVTVSDAVALYGYEPKNTDELPLQPGAQVKLLETPDGGWWKGSTSDRLSGGWFPSNYVQVQTSSSSPISSGAGAGAGAGATGNAEQQPSSPRKGSLGRVMHDERSSLNSQIERELRVRAGAENLLRALSDDKKHKAARDEVLVNLSFANAKIQALRWKLQELNAKVHACVRRSVYYHTADPAILSDESGDIDWKTAFAHQEDREAVVPMVVLGLKETTPTDLKGAFARVIEQHYHEDPADFKGELELVQRMRDAVQTYSRSSDARDQHLDYLQLMGHLEDRFFADLKCPFLSFQWYDSFNGQPTLQRSVALEKACVFFNTGALNMQLASLEDLADPKGMENAAQLFQEAAGCFQYIQDNFLHAASADMSPPALSMLVLVCLAQAQECLFLLHKHTQDKNGQEVNPGESASVAELCRQASHLLSAKSIKDYVPPMWAHLLSVKRWFYEALADFNTGVAQLNELSASQNPAAPAVFLGVARVARADVLLHKAFQHVSLHLSHMKLLQTKITSLIARVTAKLKTLDTAAVYERYSGTAKLEDMLCITPGAAVHSTAVPPNLQRQTAENVPTVADPFERLGPGYFFNMSADLAKFAAILMADKEKGYGFTLAGNAPVCVTHVEAGSVAQKAGIVVGQAIVMVDAEPVKSASHARVVELICRARDGGNPVHLILQGNTESEAERQMKQAAAAADGNSKRRGSASASGKQRSNSPPLSSATQRHASASSLLPGLAPQRHASASAGTPALAAASQRHGSASAVLLAGRSNSMGVAAPPVPKKAGSKTSLGAKAAAAAAALRLAGPSSGGGSSTSLTSALAAASAAAATAAPPKLSMSDSNSGFELDHVFSNPLFVKARQIAD